MRALQVQGQQKEGLLEELVAAEVELQVWAESVGEVGTEQKEQPAGAAWALKLVVSMQETL